MGRRTRGYAVVGPLLEQDDEETTDVGPKTQVGCPCVPCRGTGELLARFPPGSSVFRRSCVACGGTGIRLLIMQPERRLHRS